MGDIKPNKMGTARMAPLIATMALPAMLSMLIQALYNVVDSIFVARVSDEALAAVSLAFPIQMLIVSIGVGTGVGLNSLISRKLGEGDKEAASAAANHGVVLAILSGLALALFGLLVTKPFYSAFTTDAEILAGSCSYTYIITIFSSFVMLSVAAEKILQGTGNMLFPMIQNLVGAVTNIILDPIMIFGLFGFPKMGVTGAAIATVTGQCFGMCVGLFILFIKKHAVHISLRGFRMQGRIVRDIYTVGFPAIIMQSVASVMTTGLNAILISYSNTAVSVLGVYFKLQSFIFMPVFGLTQGAMPVMGYNYGARNLKRLSTAFYITSATAFVIMAVGTAIFWFYPDKLLLMFNNSQEMQTVGVPALRLISLSFIGAAFGIVNSTLFQAVGHGVASLVVSIIRQLAVLLPVAWLLGRLYGLQAIWLAFPIAEIIAFFVSFALLVGIYKKQLVTLETAK